MELEETEDGNDCSGKGQQQFSRPTASRANESQWLDSQSHGCELQLWVNG
jgi:hypothetical protein